MNRPEPCYREVTNGVYFTKNAHRHDCLDVDCRGCTTCPGRHCSARRNCTWHVADTDQTCGRCITSTRQDIVWISALSSLVLTQAITDGLNSEAANLAGPSVDPEAWSWRKITAQQGRRDPRTGKHLAWHVSLIEDDDEHHPLRVLGDWERKIRETYSHRIPAIGCTRTTADRGERSEWERHVERHIAERSCRTNHGPRCWDPATQPTTIATAAGYLNRQLHRIAQDEDQDFPLLRAELKKCRQHLESVLHNDTNPDVGAPCPKCRTKHRPQCVDPECRGCRVVRLRRQYAHWCDDDDCKKFHFLDDGSDTWHCPIDPTHWWTQQGYADLLDQRRGA